ncbi:hypothetical protein DL767_004524 [Monosporascus sp. MG133]|nr:hypothetical protein DL767_004524 [Monosporascus sp. MG133]
MDHHRRSGRIQDESSHLSRPQVFVQLQFGVSWNQRHTPSTHTLTYMSRNLRNSRDLGNFPRQVPPASTNYLAVPEPRQLRHQDKSSRHHPRHSQKRRASRGRQEQPDIQDTRPPRGSAFEDCGYMRTWVRDETRLQPTIRPQKEARDRGRAPSHERGSSAPPPWSESPWGGQGLSSTLFPPPARTFGDQSQMMTPLPVPPNTYRLGSDGMPWDAYGWPQEASGMESEDFDHTSPFVNNPTIVPLSPQRHRTEDPERVRELESLSTAMMTVDNGFENQWWYQGSRESTEFWTQAEPGSRRSMPEHLLVSAAEPTFSTMDDLAGAPPPGHQNSDAHFLVSPLSATSGSPAHGFRPLQRSLTTRSEELFFET